jgi:hypothetical protein
MRRAAALAALAFGSAWLLAVAAPATPSRAEDPPAGALDPSPRLPSHGDASEHWDLIALLDSGHRVFARFLITNLGPGKRNGAAIGHLVEPDGRVHEFRNARSEWPDFLKREGRLLDIGSSELELGAPDAAGDRRYRLDVHKEDVVADLSFPGSGGSSLPELVSGGGYASDLLALAATQGRVWVPGMAKPLEVTGRVALTHTWSERGEGDLCARRIEIFAADAGRSVYLSEVLAPGGTVRSWASLTAQDGPALREAVELAHRGRRIGARGRRYAFPAALDVSGAAMEGEVRLGSVLFEQDPLSVLPSPIRFWLSLSMHPHRIWTDATVWLSSLPASSAPIELSARGVAALTFLRRVETP